MMSMGLREAYGHLAVMCTAIALRVTYGTALWNVTVVIVGLLSVIVFARAVASGGNTRKIDDPGSGKESRPFWIAVAILYAEWLSLTAMAFIVITWGAPPAFLVSISPYVALSAFVLLPLALAYRAAERRWLRSET